MPNEGEGNKTADQEYRRAVGRYARSLQTEKKAREAAEALDDDEKREELEDAEEEARRGPQT